MTGTSRPRSVAFGAVRELLPPAALLLVALGSWLVSPSQVELATRAALHGLCAQRPSHSFWFGPYQLPFDARMTGIYAGSLLTIAWLASRRPRGGVEPPHPASIAVLGMGGVLLAVDGLNALATDLGFPTLYEPRNALRYVTGAWTGVGLGVLLWWVFQTTTWRPERRIHSPVFRLAADGLPLTLVLGAFGSLLMSGPVSFFVPVAIGLVVAALVTIAGFAWPIVLLLLGRLERASRWGELGAPAALALSTAAGFMAVTSAVRFALEAVLDLPPLP